MTELKLGTRKNSQLREVVKLCAEVVNLGGFTLRFSQLPWLHMLHLWQNVFDTFSRVI